MSPQPWPYSHVTLEFRKEKALFPKEPNCFSGE